jgi:antitoxin component of MazEF toxin-antitoxin module
MGYSVRLQKVDRPTNRSYYVNLPVVLAETLGFNKGDILEWSVKDQATLLLRRVIRRATIAKTVAKPKARKKK